MLGRVVRSSGRCSVRWRARSRSRSCVLPSVRSSVWSRARSIAWLSCRSSVRSTSVFGTDIQSREWRRHRHTHKPVLDQSRTVDVPQFSVRGRFGSCMPRAGARCGGRCEFLGVDYLLHTRPNTRAPAQKVVWMLRGVLRALCWWFAWRESTRSWRVPLRGSV